MKCCHSPYSTVSKILVVTRLLFILHCHYNMSGGFIFDRDAFYEVAEISSCACRQWYSSILYRKYEICEPVFIEHLYSNRKSTASEMPTFRHERRILALEIVSVLPEYNVNIDDLSFVLSIVFNISFSVYFATQRH